MPDMTPQIDEALKDWIVGETIVATKNEPSFNERVVVTKSDEGFSMFRAFPLGDTICVSVDQNNISADEMMAALLGGE